MTPADVQAADDVFRGGGEAGELLRRLDWRLRSVGPPAGWPQSLRTALSICLASRYPICILWGRDLLYLYNDAYAPIVGAKHPGALGALYPDVWPEIWERDIRPLLEPVLATGQASWADNLLLVLQRHGYNEECYFSFSFAPIRDEEGQVGGVFTAITETTPQVVGARRLKTLSELGARTGEAKSAGQACAAAAHVLADNRYEFPFALLYLMDRDGSRVVLAGRSGESPDDAAAPATIDLATLDVADPWSLASVLRDGRPTVVSGLRETTPGLSGGPWPESTDAAMVLPLVRAGQARPHGVLVSGISPYRALDADYADFLVLVASQVATAISNATAYEQERERAEAFAEIDRAKTLFFSNVSHEFRTPLTLILGPAEDMLADERDPLPPAQRGRVDTVYRNSLRLLKLVNTLLDFSRIEAGRVEAAYEPTDLASLTADLASNFRSAIEKAGLAFHVSCPPLPEPVHVDRTMWEKIVLNLVSNAFKFTFEGSVTVGLRAAGNRVELVVTDTGVGIPAEELPHVFSRFRRVEGTRSRTHEGTGIGLALVRELVALHGGDLSVESEVDRGTRFTVSIPRGLAHLPADRVGAARTLASTALRAEAYVEEAVRWLPGDDTVVDASGQVGVRAARDRARIVLADDNADMRHYVRRLLEGHWRVEAVADGVEALAAVRRDPPDLVLADVMMPNMDGFALLRALREDPATRHLPVVFLSARAGEESRVEGLDAGADDYLIKPFSGRELVARLEAQLMRVRLRRAQDALHERLEQVFRHAPVGICVLRGPEHVYELANPDFLKLVSGRSVLGKAVREALPELEGQGIRETLDAVYASGEPYVGRSLRLLLRDDEDTPPRERFFDLLLQPMPGRDGRTEGIVIVVFDVTALTAARREAEAANRAKDQFLAMLGHELRNPLSPILTALKVMEIRGDEATQKERAIIERQARHMARLVDDLMDVARIVSGKIELEKEPIELSRIVARAVEIAGPQLEQRRHALLLDVPGEGLVVDADETRLTQVVSNLLGNAAKYTEPSGQVTVRARREGDGVALTVHDTGIGIEPHMLGRVFDLFVQDAQAPDRGRGGLGLGLSIARSLTELHGGTLRATSDGAGRGSTFTLSLPSAAPRGVGAPRGRTEASDTAAQRIVVVDHNEDAARTVAHVMAMSGHEVRVARDGRGALDLIAGFRPHVALIDVGFPAMDGLELARRIRTQLGSGIRLVAVAGYGQAADRARAVDAGFDAHLVKPVDLEHLCALVTRFAGEKPGAAS